MRWQMTRGAVPAVAPTAAVSRVPDFKAAVKPQEFDPATTVETEETPIPAAVAKAETKRLPPRQERKNKPVRAVPITHVTRVIHVPRARAVSAPAVIVAKAMETQIVRAEVPSATPVVEPTPIAEPVTAVELEPVPVPEPPARSVTLRSGTVVYIRTVEALSSDRNAVGDTFSGTLDHPLVVDGMVIAERGARAEGHIVKAQRAGRVQGVSGIAIQLNRITTSDGQHVAVDTEPYGKQGASSTRDDAMKVGGSAGLGAVIGAIAGGGKGAAIGAAVGGAAGAGGVLMTGGKAVAIPSESVIPFRVREPVTITERMTSARN